MSKNTGAGIFQSILSVILMICFFIGLYFIAYGIFWLLYRVTPFFLIPILIIDRQSLVGYIQWLGNLLQRKFLSGLVAITLSILLYPIVLSVILLKAIVNRKVRKIEEAYLNQDRKNNYTPFVELESRKKDPKGTGNLTADSGNEYDQIFG